MPAGIVEAAYRIAAPCVDVRRRNVNARALASEKLRLSIIIPALNEEETIGATLDAVRAEHGGELIVVDGKSTDRTADIARSYGATVITSARGRAFQMNAGADAASGDVLLFLHADTLLPRGFGHQVSQVLAGPDVVAGAFRLGIDAPGLIFRLIEKTVQWRSSFLQLPYGDQALFLEADTFRRMGRFPEWPVMEDFELVCRLRQRGRVGIATGLAKTSARRWLDHGTWWTTATNLLCAAAYFLGVSPERIARWRRGIAGSALNKSRNSAWRLLAGPSRQEKPTP